MIAIGLLVGCVVALNYANQIESPILAGLVDPLGLVTLERLTQYWTEAERNSRLIGLPAALVWNRAFWLGVAAVVLALLHATFRLARPDGGGRRKGRRHAAASPSDRLHGRLSVVDPDARRASVYSDRFASYKELYPTIREFSQRRRA